MGANVQREKRYVAKQDPTYFIAVLARGQEVIRAFEPNRPAMTLSEVAAATGLARPTARRMLLTLEELGYVRLTQGGFVCTYPARAGARHAMPYIEPNSIWDIARAWSGW